MAREIPGLPGMVDLDEADLTDEERALSEWAESADPDGSVVLRGAAEAGRALLVAALGSEEAVARAVGGRRPLDPGAQAGSRSPVRTVRLPEQTNARLAQVARAQGRRPSDVIREALDQYLADAG